MKSIIAVNTLLLLLTFITACGPSPEQIATMTASIWTSTPPPTQTPIPPTPTPVPTSTPTPEPYNLSLLITDDQGAPIAGAEIALAGSSNNEPLLTDTSGKYSLANLPGEVVTLKILASGYMPAEQAATIKRGQNEIAIKLTRDPFGLLPSDACAKTEKPLYIEDFQDKRAKGWNEIDLKTPGWEMLPSTDDAANIILSAQYSEMLGDQPLNSRLMNGMKFDNAV